jgi:hypothetical protein
VDSGDGDTPHGGAVPDDLAPVFRHSELCGSGSGEPVSGC